MNPFKVGDRVSHRWLGEGTVEQIEGDQCFVRFDRYAASWRYASTLKPVKDAAKAHLTH